MLAQPGRVHDGRQHGGDPTTASRGPATPVPHAVTVTAGGALALPGDSPETLLHRADTAMYAAAF